MVPTCGASYVGDRCAHVCLCVGTRPLAVAKWVRRDAYLMQLLYRPHFEEQKEINQHGGMPHWSNTARVCMSHWSNTAKGICARMGGRGRTYVPGPAAHSPIKSCSRNASSCLRNGTASSLNWISSTRTFTSVTTKSGVVDLPPSSLQSHALPLGAAPTRTYSRHRTEKSPARPSSHRTCSTSALPAWSSMLRVTVQLSGRLESLIW
mmetsp:Transcript_20722/g.52462  ORF Transcript_20722/g.52462 Transcript_20722/m.52462 type:complete len:207 (-) Transcript_20722:1106-1726(-)